MMGNFIFYPKPLRKAVMPHARDKTKKHLSLRLQFILHRSQKKLDPKDNFLSCSQENQHFGFCDMKI